MFIGPLLVLVFGFGIWIFLAGLVKRRIRQMLFGLIVLTISGVLLFGPWLR